MQAVQQAFAGTGDGDRGPETRADVIRTFENLWNDGIIQGPQFVVGGPYHMGGRLREEFRGRPDIRRWGGWTTTFDYVFDAKRPWFPEQILRGFRVQYERLDAAETFKAPRVTLKLRFKEVCGPGDVDFPDTPPLTPARNAAANFGTRTIATLDRYAAGAENEEQWRRLLQTLAREDRYDAVDGVEEQYGNRLSRATIIVYEWRLPQGAGLADELGVPPRSVVDLVLPLTTTLCGQACLAYAIAPPSQRKNYRDPRRVTCLNAAEKLAKELGHEGAMDVSDFDLFTAKYPQYSVTIMEGREQVLYRSKTEERYPTPIYLLLYQRHYYFIPKIDAFARPTRDSRMKWCHECAALITPRGFKHHACVGNCRRCLHYFVDAADREDHYTEIAESCARCNFSHRYKGCAAHHRCDRWLCLECEGIYPMARRDAHTCGETYCRECSVFTAADDGPHRCYILKKKPGRISDNVWAYDIESTLDPLADKTITAHKIAIIVAMKLYTRETHIFAGDDPADEFLRWLETPREAGEKTITLIAHNGAGYDNYLILQEIKKRRIALPQTVIMDGQKLIYMEYAGARFIDSARHVAGSLERLAKTFGLPMAKGFFPYTFFTTANRGYAGDVPARHFFETARMTPSRLRELAAWHLEREADYILGNDYVLMDECVKYCRLDVELLAAAMEKYRDAGLEATGVDPLQRVTIASYAQDVYRCNYMPERSLPILKRDEYDFVRQGFYGGRTDVRQVYRAWSPAEIAAGGGAAYVDVVSLYPAVLRYDRLPCGAPWWVPQREIQQLTTPEACADWLAALEASGRVAMVSCEVVCPRDLYHPVLLKKVDGRLMARLDIASGVWPSNELGVALGAGYKVSRILRALCSETSGGLFTGYVDAYVAMKQTHAPSGPVPNVGLYLLAKMMLNSLWGKFGQRDLVKEPRFYSGERGPEAWYRAVGLFHRGALETLDVHEVNADYLFATATKAGTENLHLRTTDALLAGFVTACGRIRLYAMLQRLGERVIMHDTDSLIYERVPGQYSVPIGNGLGEWSDETYDVVADRADPIAEFVGLGPKTYAYRTLHGKETVKSKGFSSGFTLEQYKSLALPYLAGEKADPLIQKRLHFKRIPAPGGEGQIVTVPDFTKNLVVSLQKVHVVSARRTVPYGHEEHV